MRLVLDRLRMDDNFRIMNAIAPTEPAQQSTEPTRKTIELSEQTPLSGFDRKQKQVEAGEISDVGASIARVGDRGRQSDAAAANYGAAVGWEETKADARADVADRRRRRRAARSASCWRQLRAAGEGPLARRPRAAHQKYPRTAVRFAF